MCLNYKLAPLTKKLLELYLPVKRQDTAHTTKKNLGRNEVKARKK